MKKRIYKYKGIPIYKSDYYSPNGDPGWLDHRLIIGNSKNLMECQSAGSLAAAKTWIDENRK